MFKVGDIIKSLENIRVDEVIAVSETHYTLKCISNKYSTNETYEINTYLIEIVNEKARKLTKLEKALK